MTQASLNHPSPRSRVRRGVIGIMLKGSNLLVIRRADGVAKGGCWCFPGGHVEPGETPRRAVQRELREELGIEVVPVKRLGSIRVVDSNHILAVWQVHHAEGRFQPAYDEVAEVRWLCPAAVRALRPNLPSNEKVLEMLGL